MGAGTGAVGAGLLRMPVLRWLGRRAGRQQRPTAWLLLAAAALFLAPILPLFALGAKGPLAGLMPLLLNAPFLVTYVVAAYRLRQHLTAA